MSSSGIFGPPRSWPHQDLIALSAEFDTEMVRRAYPSGVFPMPLPESGFSGMGWWSPIRRGVLALEGLRVTRSLRKSAKHYRTSVDVAFEDVLAACADPDRPGRWIDQEITGAYAQLHAEGVAHSVEVWGPSGRLVGGLYGVGFGGLFAGESMFHDPVDGRDASKVALLRLVEVLSDQYADQRLIDVQWRTDHLATLGVVELDRLEYLELLPDLLSVPEPDWFCGGGQVEG